MAASLPSSSILLVALSLVVALCITAPGQLVRAADEDPLQDFCVADANAAITINGRTCKPAGDVTAQDFTSTLLRAPAAAATYDSYHTSGSQPSSNVSKAAIVTLASVATFPGLNTQGLSIARIDFPPNGGLNPPHVHPRATEVLLLAQGTLTVGFISTNNNPLFQATLYAGDLFVFPRGLPHFQINPDEKTPALAISELNSQNPGVSQLAAALFAANPPVPSIVLQNTFGIEQAEVEALTASVEASLA